MIGDKWTMLVVRDLFAGPKRTTELLEDLHPISSRTLMGRLREMEQDDLILRNNYGGLPRRVEYELTERGRRLIPLLDALMRAGRALDCNNCEERRESAGYYCDFCPHNAVTTTAVEMPERIEPPERQRQHPRGSVRRSSIARSVHGKALCRGASPSRFRRNYRPPGTSGPHQRRGLVRGQARRCCRTSSPCTASRQPRGG